MTSSNALEVQWSPPVARIVTVHTGAVEWFVITWGPNIGATGGQITAFIIRVRKKKRVALIMLIIALQFDVSTSKKKKRVALIMLIIALMN